MFYWEDRTTGLKKRPLTRDEAEARKLIQAKNDAVAQPLMNLAKAKTYLAAQDPKLITRTWADVIVRFCNRRSRSPFLLPDRPLEIICHGNLDELVPRPSYPRPDSASTPSNGNQANSA